MTAEIWWFIVSTSTRSTSFNFFFVVVLFLELFISCEMSKELQFCVIFQLRWYLPWNNTGISPFTRANFAAEWEERPKCFNLLHQCMLRPRHCFTPTLWRAACLGSKNQSLREITVIVRDAVLKPCSFQE